MSKKFINAEIKITKEQAHELLMRYKSHYLWHKEYKKWTIKDYENILVGKNKNPSIMSNWINPELQPVEVIFNDGRKENYPSIGDLSYAIQLSQGAISNILAGRRNTKRFLSIKKI